mmetsp:Transcript_57120/g.68301  ORF Transcript_57120/g.68301 Transcript_57120/m.68301 type:complete len:84 (-) Transcript_57120:328-579(-)
MACHLFVDDCELRERVLVRAERVGQKWPSECGGGCLGRDKGIRGHNDDDSEREVICVFAFDIDDGMVKSENIVGVREDDNERE